MQIHEPLFLTKPPRAPLSLNWIVAPLSLACLAIDADMGVFRGPYLQGLNAGSFSRLVFLIACPGLRISFIRIGVSSEQTALVVIPLSLKQFGFTYTKYSLVAFY